MNRRATFFVPMLVLVLLAAGAVRIAFRDHDPLVRRPRGVVHEITATRLDDGRVKLLDHAWGVMGTEVVLTLFGHDEPTLRAAAAAAFARIEELEARLSKWRSKSEISRVNARAGEVVAVHSETLALVERAITLGRETGGAFDITVGPLVEFWRQRETLPLDDEIAAVRARVGLHRIEVLLEPAVALRLAPDSRIDLGGIAKGAIVDEVARVLGDAGVQTFLVNAGGDMLARGAGPSGEGLLIALRDPAGVRGALLDGGRLRLRDEAVCTSGSYERFREVEGHRIGHIIDPRTGHPVNEIVLQASVIAPDAETADALATALMVLGAEEGLRVIRERDGVDALLVVRDGDAPRIFETPGFARRRAEAAR